MVTVYVHIGLHKTGTTTLQHFLNDNEKELLTKDVLYPNAGKPKKVFDYAHHNLAWQINRDKRCEANEIDQWLKMSE